MKRVLILCGAPLLFSGVAHAGKRGIALPPIPSANKPSRPSTGKFVSGVQHRSNAQLLSEIGRPRNVELSGDVLSLAPRDVVLLPFSGVTRIITEDDDVARAFFQNGSPVLQALAPGTTTVEIYQTSGTPRVLTVNVAASKTGTPTPLATPEPTEAPTATPEPTEAPIADPPPVADPPPIADPPPVADPPVDTPPALGDPFGNPLPTATPEPTNNVNMGNIGAPPIVPARSGLLVALRQAPATAGQTQLEVNFSNTGTAPARGVVVRLPLDARVQVVPGSISGGGTFDAARNEVVWRVGDLPARSSLGSGVVRITPVQRDAFGIDLAASIEDASGETPLSSAQVRYTVSAPRSTASTPLLTVFAFPDRFLAGVSGPRFQDVSDGSTRQAVDRLQQQGVVNGRSPGQYQPLRSTMRAEYAVMTLKSLNLRDLRELTQLKFVLSRPSTVNLWIQSASGARVADLVRETRLEVGEHTVAWNGKSPRGLVPAGRYTYVCSAKDERGDVTTLRGVLSVVTVAPLELEGGLSTFADVRPSDWYAPYLGVGEKQGLWFGFPDKTFRPLQSISRVEATAIAVRAMGLADMASKWQDKDVGFEDFAQIPAWGKGVVNVATTGTKTSSGNPLMRGTPGNHFEPLNPLRRDQAALMISRLIDRETTRRISVSGAIVPGAVVSINSRPVSADGEGHFAFSFDMMTSTPVMLSVVDTRNNAF